MRYTHRAPFLPALTPSAGYLSRSLTFHGVLHGRRRIHAAHNVAEAVLNGPHIETIVADAEAVLRMKRRNNWVTKSGSWGCKGITVSSQEVNRKGSFVGDLWKLI